MDTETIIRKIINSLTWEQIQELEAVIREIREGREKYPDLNEV